MEFRSIAKSAVNSLSNQTAISKQQQFPWYLYTCRRMTCPKIYLLIAATGKLTDWVTLTYKRGTAEATGLQLL